MVKLLYYNFYKSSKKVEGQIMTFHSIYLSLTLKYTCHLIETLHMDLSHISFVDL